MTDPESDIGAHAVAQVRHALTGLQDPQNVRALFASILAIPLREVEPERRLGVAGRFVADALRVIDMEGQG